MISFEETQFLTKIKGKTRESVDLFSIHRLFLDQSKRAAFCFSAIRWALWLVFFELDLFFFNLKSRQCQFFMLLFIYITILELTIYFWCLLGDIRRLSDFFSKNKKKNPSISHLPVKFYFCFLNIKKQKVKKNWCI